MKRTKFPINNNSGIYEIVCIPTGKRYIGSSINTIKRKQQHLKGLRSGNHCNTYLQRSFNKYGEKNFKFYLIHSCEKEDLIKWEQIYLDKLRLIDFNICSIAESRLGTKFSENSKNKISKNRKGKYIKEANHNYGKPLPDGVRLKIKQTLMGKYVGENSPSYGIKRNEETCKKISQSQIGRIPWNKGLTAKMDERVKKYVDANIGKIVLKETREKIRNTLLGREITKEVKEKLSIAQIKRWGSFEEREKQRIRMLGKISGMYGKKHSEETKQKMREIHKLKKERVLL